MTLSKAMKDKLNARKSEFEYDAETLNQKLAYATTAYHQGLPELGAGTETHSKVILIFKDILTMLEQVRTTYKAYSIDNMHTRSRDNVFKVALIKPEAQQNRELELIESDIKRAYKDSLAETKETVISEILEEVTAEKFAAEEQKRLDKIDKEHNALKQALLDAA